MTEVVIISGCRTAIGEFGGTLRDIHAANIASVPMKEAVERAGIPADMIEDVRFGCCLNPTDAMNVTRIGALMAGIPDERSCRDDKSSLHIRHGGNFVGRGHDQGRGGRCHSIRRRGAHVRCTVHRGEGALGSTNGQYRVLLTP